VNWVTLGVVGYATLMVFVLAVCRAAARVGDLVVDLDGTRRPSATPAPDRYRDGVSRP
jgi:hypothetical protein